MSRALSEKDYFMWFFIVISFIGGGFCSLFFAAGQVARREINSSGNALDPIQQQLDAEMHHFNNGRYREFDRAAWALVDRDFTIQTCFGDPRGLTQAQKEHLVDEVILNNRRNKNRVGYPLQFGQF